MSAGSSHEQETRADPVITAPAESAGPTTPSEELSRSAAAERARERRLEKNRPAKLGRYHLLELVGSGGMGVVWGAWDPELDRRVAIKLVHPTLRAARERILGEGQALARLSHPNVVPVYDVGVVDDQLYIVMEWVRGRTLRAYGKEPRRVRDIVAVYRAAGAGLAAAHRAGLIHRDFKPDNAILGDDGRVRVVDFGLARGEVKTRGDVPVTPQRGVPVTRGAGTPRYMAPEQLVANQLTPAVDQYAFGAALREALAGRAADGTRAVLPRWLDEIATRSTAVDPASRYPSMDALLDALARDPAAVRRRRLLVAGAIGAAAGAFVVGQLRSGETAVERCAGGADVITKVWSDGARARVVDHLCGLGPYGNQEAARLEEKLRSYSTAWAAAHRDACLAQSRGELTPALYERSLACLTRGRVAFETIVDLLSSVESDGVPGAVVAARGLPTPERCALEAPFSTVPLPTAEIASEAADVANDVERARTLVTAQSATMREVAAAAAARADQLRYPPLVARAQLVLGRALQPEAARNAIGPYQRARSIALEVGDYAMAVEAYARELFALAVSPRTESPPIEAEPGAIAMAESLAKGLDPRGAFARALLYNNLGALRYTLGDRDGARAAYERALEATQAVDGQRYEIVQAWANLGRMSRSGPERAEYFTKGIAAIERELGPDHPETLAMRISAAIMVENPHASVAALREPCEARARLHPHIPLKIDDCMYSLGWMLEELGNTTEARSAFDRIHTDPHVAPLAAGYLLLLDGKLEEAATRMVALADELDRHTDYWVKYRAADARLLVASSELGLRHRDVAIRQLQRTLETLDSMAKVLGNSALYRRRRARVEFLLARALATTDHAAAVQYAVRAADWFRTAGGYEARLAEMNALITGSP